MIEEGPGLDPGNPASRAGQASHIRSFVLRQTRMTKAQTEALADLGPRWILPFGDDLLDFPTVFGNHNPVVLEIGFGMGHATALIAKANPDTNYLAVEVHSPGVGALLLRIQEEGLTNIRIVQKDVVLVLDRMVPPRSLAGIHVFFPDPWQKKRHHKRRLIQAPFLDRLATYGTSGAYIYLATDWEDYALWMLDEFAKSPVWRNRYEHWAPLQDWRPRTAFEHKGLEKQHTIRELFFVRADA